MLPVTFVNSPQSVQVIAGREYARVPPAANRVTAQAILDAHDHVHFPAGTYELDGDLSITSGQKRILIDRGATITFQDGGTFTWTNLITNNQNDDKGVGLIYVGGTAEVAIENYGVLNTVNRQVDTDGGLPVIANGVFANSPTSFKMMGDWEWRNGNAGCFIVDVNNPVCTGGWCDTPDSGGNNTTVVAVEGCNGAYVEAHGTGIPEVLDANNRNTNLRAVIWADDCDEGVDWNGSRLGHLTLYARNCGTAVRINGDTGARYSSVASFGAGGWYGSSFDIEAEYNSDNTRTSDPAVVWSEDTVGDVHAMDIRLRARITGIGSGSLKRVIQVGGGRDHKIVIQAESSLTQTTTPVLIGLGSNQATHCDVNVQYRGPFSTTVPGAAFETENSRIAGVIRQTGTLDSQIGFQVANNGSGGNYIVAPIATNVASVTQDLGSKATVITS